MVLAVDNDASQTGIKKTMQAAKPCFGGRAQAIQPEFTMTQIQQYQREKGLDATGNPQLPSDFNDLHHLAGIDAVKTAFDDVFRLPEIAPSRRSAKSAAGNIRRYGTGHRGRSPFTRYAAAATTHHRSRRTGGFF